MSVSALENLHCVKCDETTTHQRRICIHCSTPNNSSGLRPVPRGARPERRPTNYAARAEDASAKRRARAARGDALTRIRA
jgi:hypothetical protein